MSLTLSDLLTEPCENYTSGTCADAGSERVPVSDSGTWNQYCGPCRLRYVMRPVQDVVSRAHPSHLRSDLIRLIKGHTNVRACNIGVDHDPHVWFPAPFESKFRGVHYQCLGYSKEEFDD